MKVLSRPMYVLFIDFVAHTRWQLECNEKTEAGNGGNAGAERQLSVYKERRRFVIKYYYTRVEMRLLTSWRARFKSPVSSPQRLKFKRPSCYKHGLQ